MSAEYVQVNYAGACCVQIL